MVYQLFNLQEKIIHLLLQQGNETSSLFLSVVSEGLQRSPRMIEHQLSHWRKKTGWPFFQLNDQQIFLVTSPVTKRELYLQLLQENTTLQLLWYLFESPFARCRDLEKVFYCSPSTIRRYLKKLQLFLKPYQIKLSFESHPTLQGCEYQIRWLGWFLSLIFDPPFDWRSPSELFERFEETQNLRIQTGQSLNDVACTPTLDLPFLLTERAWTYLGREWLVSSAFFDHLNKTDFSLLFQPENSRFVDSNEITVPSLGESFFVAEQKEVATTVTPPLSFINI
ncbi:helix-turn-helix domain-containing protein [Enterococcus sp. LJL98]